MGTVKNLPAVNLAVKTPAAVLDSFEHMEQQKPQLVKQQQQSSQSSAFIAKQEAVVVPLTRHQPEPDFIDYLDPRVHQKGPTRQRRATFQFKNKGEYEKLANVQRSKAKLDKLQSEISRAAKQTGISSAVKLAIVTPSGTESMDNYIPTIEWWDEIVLGNGKG